jgi:hypothetical protein
MEQCPWAKYGFANGRSLWRHSPQRRAAPVGHKDCKSQRTLTPGAIGGRNAAADEENSDQRSDSHTHKQYAKCPRDELSKEHRQTDMRGIHQHHRYKRDVVTEREGEKDEDPCYEPIVPLDRRRKQALNKSVCSRTCDTVGGKRMNDIGARK